MQGDKTLLHITTHEYNLWFVHCKIPVFKLKFITKRRISVRPKREVAKTIRQTLYFSCRMLARSQYPERPATGHLGTGFSWFPCVYKRMLRWFPRLQVATACFLCSPPDLNFVDPQFIFMYTHCNHCHRATAHLQLNILLLLLLLLSLKTSCIRPQVITALTWQLGGH